MASSQHHQFRLTKLAAALAVPVALGSYHQSAAAIELEEVIVTAQKRSESVMEIPSTVNVIDGEEVKEFCRGMNSPKGMAFVGGYLVVADDAWEIMAQPKRRSVAAPVAQADGGRRTASRSHLKGRILCRNGDYRPVRPNAGVTEGPSPLHMPPACR